MPVQKSLETYWMHHVYIYIYIYDYILGTSESEYNSATEIRTCLLRYHNLGYELLFAEWPILL